MFTCHRKQLLIYVKQETYLAELLCIQLQWGNEHAQEHSTQLSTDAQANPNN
jgi:hypothetical protein